MAALRAAFANAAGPTKILVPASPTANDTAPTTGTFYERPRRRVGSCLWRCYSCLWVVALQPFCWPGGMAARKPTGLCA